MSYEPLIGHVERKDRGAPPRLDRKELIARGALFLGIAVYLSLFLRYTASDPDEGIVLQGAQRILQGQLPYRDFFSFYTPLSYYWLAGFLRIFGSRIEVARASLVLIGAICALVTYTLARRVCSFRWSLTAAILAGMTTLPYRFLVLHNWDSTLWACLGIYAGLRFVEAPGAGWAFTTGSLVALTGLSEQSKGFGLGLGVVAGWILTNYLAKGKVTVRKSHAAGFLAGLAWPAAAVAAYFAAHGALLAMLSGWMWPLKHYTAANHVPYGYQNWSDKTRTLLFATGTTLSRVIKVLAVSPCFLLPVLPIIALLLLAYWWFRKKDPACPQQRANYYVFMGCAVSGLLVSVVLVRPDIVHFMYLLPVLAIVLGWVLDGRDIPGTIYRAIRPAFATVMVTGFLLMAFSFLYVAVQSRKHSIATRRGTINALRDDGVVAYVASHTTAGEHILVYPYLPLYYYLTGTFSPDGYEYLQPGMTTTQQAADMVRDLEAKPVRVVILEPSFADKIATSWPGTTPADIWRDPVSDYVLHHYHFCKALQSSAAWTFLFMVRQNESCPAN